MTFVRALSALHQFLECSRVYRLLIANFAPSPPKIETLSLAGPEYLFYVFFVSKMCEVRRRKITNYPGQLSNLSSLANYAQLKSLLQKHYAKYCVARQK